MDMTELFLLAAPAFVGKILSGLYVALGLGLVIFFHELGHFAVAKWCDVHVERFSIGFGPVLWSRKKGETEYALSLIPFGGYVKMLGQDDMDPSQLTSEEIAEDPRAYSSKSVPQRMAIISAGVIMNVVTGMIFFALAFGIGVQSNPSTLGGVHVGSPAWAAGLEAGDTITGIKSEGDEDFREVVIFGDIMRGVALTDGQVTIRGVDRDGKAFEVTLEPDASGTRRIIGAGPMMGSRTVAAPPDASIPVVREGSPAAAADPTFRPGDVIVRVNDEEFREDDPAVYVRLQEYLARHRGEALDFHVRRDGAPADDLTKITVGPQPFSTLGLSMDIGRITALRKGSPAEKAGLRKDDRITHVDGRVVGTEVDPLTLPDYFGDKGEAGETVELTISRDVKSGEPEKSTLAVRPAAKPGWIEQPVAPNMPLSIPAIGIAYEIYPFVLKVDEQGPAAGKIHPEDRIRRIELDLEEGFAKRNGEKTVSFDFRPKDKDKKAIQDWAYPFYLLQEYPVTAVRLTVERKGESDHQTVELTPQPAAAVPLADGGRGPWYYPGDRGVLFAPALIEQVASGPVDAVRLGLLHTRNSAADIYLTLRSLFRGDLSVTELHGPIGIAKMGYRIASHGIPEFLLFLGFLSVNLAVLNFLPIPVLDGGHMVFLIWEGVTRRKPSERVVASATYAGLAFVLGLMIFVLYLDIFVHGSR